MCAFDVLSVILTKGCVYGSYMIWGEYVYVGG